MKKIHLDRNQYIETNRDNQRLNKKNENEMFDYKRKQIDIFSSNDKSYQKKYNNSYQNKSENRDDQQNRSQQYDDRQQSKQQYNQNDDRDYDNRNKDYYKKNSLQNYQPKDQLYQNKEQNNPYQFSNNQYKQQQQYKFQNNLKEHDLPITYQRNQIISALNLSQNQVIIISGDTGCGKSTQVPQFIYESNMSNQKLNIIITQPRRMAAENLARRVHLELKQKYGQQIGELGDTVGFQISRNCRASQKTQITFMTQGIFLQRITKSDQLINQFSHIILDEVHERDLDSDFILLSIKHLLKQSKEVKVILMSATINAEKFAQYFGKNSIESIHDKFYQDKLNKQIDLENLGWGNYKANNNDSFGWNEPQQNIKNQLEFPNWQQEIDILAPIIKIGFKSEFKIKCFFIDQIQQFYQMTNPYHNSKIVDISMMDFYLQRPILYDSSTQQCLFIIQHIFTINERNIKPPDSQQPLNQNGIILIFLPGINEIYNLIDRLQEILDKKKVEIMPLHSSTPQQQQQTLFQPPDRGIRRIIVATNIAESSITVKNVTYVIDFCLNKEVKYNANNGLERLELNWASKASMMQRQGRTGRVCHGFCIRLIPKNFYDNQIKQYQTPEILRTPLEKIILKIKQMNQTENERQEQDQLFKSPLKVLNNAIDPPEIENIILAFYNLQDHYALTKQKSLQDITKAMKDAVLTKVGEIYSDLPMNISLARLCVMGQIFDCLFESIIIGSILGQAKTIFLKIPKGQSQNKYQSIYFLQNLYNFDENSYSDFQILLNIYQQWEDKFINKNPILQEIQQKSQLNQQKTELKDINFYDYELYEEDNPTIQNYKSFITQRRRQRKVYYRDSIDEVSWCQKNNLDITVLEEVLICKVDLENRLKKHNLIPKQKSQDQEKINFMICGAFYQNMIYAKTDLNDNQKCEINYLETQKLNPKNTIIVTQSENLTSIMQYDQSSAEKAIKAILTFQQSRKDIKVNKHFKNKQQYQDKQFAFFEQLGNFEYLYMSRYHNLFNQNTVVIESQSINHISLSDQYFIADNYFESQNSKYMTDVTLKLPNYPLIQCIIQLIFAPIVSILSDQKQQRCRWIKVANHFDISLDYSFTNHDVSNLQQIRDSLNEQFKLDIQKKDIWLEIKNYLNQDRKKFFDEEIWMEDLTIIEPPVKKKTLFAQLKNAKNQQKEKKQIQTEETKYLENLVYPQLENQIDLSKEGQENYYLKWIRYNMYKVDVLKSIEEIESRIRINQATVICEQCKDRICVYKCIGPIELQYRNLRKFTPNEYEVNIINPQNNKQYSLMKNSQDFFNEMTTLSKSKNLGNFEYIGCKNNHVYGIKFENLQQSGFLCHIILQSRLAIIYPDQEIIPFDYFDFDPKEVEIRDYKSQDIAKIKIKDMDMRCKICDKNKKFNIQGDFIKHINSRDHQLRLKEFKRSLSYNLGNPKVN